MNSFFCSLTRGFSGPGAVLAAAILLAGCGRNDVTVYKVAKEPQPGEAQSAATTMPAGHPEIGATAAPQLQFKAPAGWEQVAPGQMRVASFKIQGEGGKQADVGVVPLPGLMGHDLENVNRWREAVGLPAVKEEELGKLAQPVEVAGQPAQLYEQAGENPGSGEKERILAAVARRDGVAWFFKMTGDDALVTKQKSAFVEFLKSVTFPSATAQTGLPASHPPVPDLLSSAADTGAGASQAKPDWQVPAGWQEVPGGSFLVAKFQVSGSDNSQAAVNVSQANGEGGGVAMNVNRWRGQLGLPPLSETELSKALSQVDTAGGKAMLVEMTGTDPRTSKKASLVGAILPRSGQTWFYKIMGDEQVVQAQKAAFERFVTTAKY